jgi:hypothetical protein
MGGSTYHPRHAIAELGVAMGAADDFLRQLCGAEEPCSAARRLDGLELDGRLVHARRVVACDHRRGEQRRR